MVIMSSRDVYAENVEDSEVEPGEEMESDPPFKVGEERRIEKYGITKKLLCAGVGWENPRYGDEVTVHYVGSLLDGSEFVSSRRNQEPSTFKLRNGEIVTGLMHGIHTMEKGEKALFTLPPDLAYGADGADGANGVPPNSTVLFEVELVSWLTVVDVCKDGGIEKKVISVGLLGEQPGNLDQVTVKFEAKLLDGRIIYKTPDEGVEFYLNDGFFCPALSKALMTMNKGENALLIVQPQYGFGEEGHVASDGFSSVPSNSTLVICVELVSLKPVLHVTGDLNVVKKILEEGKGLNYPEDGSVVQVRYTGMLEDGTMFERKGTDAPFTFVLHEENVTEGLDKAVATMKKWEKAVVTVKPDFGYGDIEVQADLAKVPASSTLTYNVELIDFTSEKEPYEMSELEKVKFAERKKEEGNTLYKAEKYIRALKRYEKAGEYVYKEYGFRDYKKESNSLRISILLNKAACTLKLNDFRATIRHCSLVLQEESQNVKALYRRAQAYIQTSDLDSADKDVKVALEIDPHDKDVQKTQQVLKQLIAVRNKTEVQLYSNMLSKLSGDTDSRAAKRMKTGDDSERIVERAEVIDPNQPQEAGQV